MGAGNWFWIVFVMMFLFGGFWGFQYQGDRRWLGGGFVLFVLVGLLGWGLFGPPIK